ncbi:Uncharacterised protein [Corynebacterium renale]|uniref:hypothetical protein n=1 Tax=Corynebacterium renale TaxID=1724 RepID=UPI000DA40F0A|nr:hypothetical protein [Corynebacterium renale]SQG64696.1 Uncharacterised protein [Corynebacterium renale]STC95955.1 Uncharacterised protein [Corynebacterium renale]
MEQQSAQAQCQELVDSFVADLEMFATGSYLAEDETDLWDQPFDPSAIPHIQTALTNFLDAVDALARSHPSLPQEDVRELAATTIQELESINAEFAYAVLEPEEFDEVNAILIAAFQVVGADEDSIEQLPILE